MASSLFQTHPIKPKLESQQTSDKADLTIELQLACRRGEIQRLKSILSQCQDDQLATFINTRDPQSGLTALSSAVIRGHRNIVLFLLSLDADPSICDFQDWNALHWAVHSGYIEIACHLVRAGTQINTVPGGGQTKPPLPDFVTPISPFQLAINERFSLIDQFIHDKSNTQKSQLDKINQLASKARIENKPGQLDVIYSMIQPTWTPIQQAKWNMFAILANQQQCIDFAAKCLNDSPIPAEFGTVDTDAIENDQDDGGLYLDDSSDDDN